tara:strand:- start:3039 stop:3587 length:549 start_codon:yes stop_codon:yes gene_type:complete
MTIICAAKAADGRVWLGSDQLVARHPYPILEGGPKWGVREGGLAFANAGHTRLDHIAERLEVWAPDPWDFSIALRDALRDDGWVSDKDDDARPVSYGTMSIFVSNGNIHVLDSGLTPGPIYHGFAAVGSGAGYAIAVATAARLFGPQLLLAEPELLVSRAVETAIELDEYCGGEPWVHEVSS